MRRFGWVALGCLAVACSQLSQERALPLSYEITEFSLNSDPGCHSDTVACASFRVTYPRFNGLDSTVSAALTDRIAFWLSGGAEGETKSMAVLANDFVRDYQQMRADVPEYGLGWTYNARVQVLVASDTLISLQVDVESFTGGAHGSYATNFVNIDPRSGTPFLLDAFLKPGYQEVLNRLGERDFRLQREMEEAASLEDAGFHFPSNQFQLNENYGFRKEGIVFFFNSYEIAAYAEGPTEILIPYEELRGWYRE